MYLGSENHLSVERKYTSKFLCDLDLALYPFDVQRCFMDLQVLSAATDFVVLAEAISSVSYVGAELLIEYEVRGSLADALGSDGGLIYFTFRILLHLKESLYPLKKLHLCL